MLINKIEFNLVSEEFESIISAVVLLYIYLRSVCVCVCVCVSMSSIEFNTCKMLLHMF